MRTQAVRILRWLVGALVATGLAAALATAGESAAPAKGCPFLVPRDKFQIEIAKVRFSEQIVSDEGRTVEVPKNRRILFRYAIVTLKVTKPPGEKLLLPLAGLTLHYYHGGEPDVCPCEAASALTAKLGDERPLKFPWEGPGWPQQTTSIKTTESGEVYIDVVYPMMETDTKECWITLPEPSVSQPFLADGWKTVTAPEAPAPAEKGARGPKQETPAEKGAPAPKAQPPAQKGEQAPAPKPQPAAETRPCPLVGMGNGVAIDIARVAFVERVVGIDGNDRRIPDDQRRSVFRYGLITLRIRKPSGLRFTLAAADLTLHYNRAERSDWAPCDGLSTFSRSLDTERLMKLQDSQGPGWMKQTTNAAATDASEVYVDCLFPSMEKDVREIWICVSTPTAKAPFVSEGWQPRPPGAE